MEITIFSLMYSLGQYSKFASFENASMEPNLSVIVFEENPISEHIFLTDDEDIPSILYFLQ